MKKTISALLVILLAFCLCSCGDTNKTSSANTPDEICLNGLSMSYYDTEIPEEFWDADVDFYVNGESKIRSITITTSDIQTYNGISVGDSVNEVTSKYKYEKQLGHTYFVLFSGKTEIEAGTQSENGDYIFINYYCDDDNQVETIVIYDAVFAKTMK